MGPGRQFPDQSGKGRLRYFLCRSYLHCGRHYLRPGRKSSGPFYGLPYASIYNPVTNVWTRLPDMNAARWYPTTTFTGTGEVLVMTGTIDSTQLENPLPQVWQPSTGTWRDLTNALLKIRTYSWVYWTQFGNAVVVGPGKTHAISISPEPVPGHSLPQPDPAYRAKGRQSCMTPGKILIAGGDGQNGDHPPTNTAEIIDLSAPTPTWQYTNPMAFPRRQMNMTMLPDDKVLVTGGTAALVSTIRLRRSIRQKCGTLLPKRGPRWRARRWVDSTIRTPCCCQTDRVLSAGGNFTYQTELYSPPYLFKGARPTIPLAPASISYAHNVLRGDPECNQHCECQAYPSAGSHAHIRSEPADSPD